MKKLLIAVAIAVASLSSYAAITAGMTAEQVKAEVEAAKKAVPPKSADTLASEAFKASIPAAAIGGALFSAGQTLAEVTYSLVKAGYDANLVISATTALGGTWSEMFAAAIKAGADEKKISPPSNPIVVLNKTPANASSGGNGSATPN